MAEEQEDSLQRLRNIRYLGHNQISFFPVSHEMARIYFSLKVNRQYHIQENCNFTLIAGLDETRIRVHLGVITEFSIKIRALSLNIHEYRIENCTGEFLKWFTDSIYAGIAKVYQDNLLDICDLAHQLNSQQYKYFCKYFMEDQLKLEPLSCLPISLITKRYAMHRIYKIADQMISTYFVELSQTDLFLRLTFDELKGFMERDDLDIVEEEQVFEAAMRWVEFDEMNRQIHMADILKLIRLPNIEETFLAAKIKPICDSLGLDQLYADVLTWMKIPIRRSQLLQGYTTHARFKSLKKIIAVGGTNERGIVNIEEYCPWKDTWTHIKNIKMPDERIQYASIVVNNFIYVIGGSTNNPVKSMSKISLDNYTMSSLASMHVARSDHSVVLIDDFIYAVGGWYTSGTVERYSIPRNKWYRIRRMDQTRECSGAVEFSGCLFVVGGNDNRSRPLDTIEFYNPQSNQWRPLPSMNIKRSSPAVAVLNRSLYVVGGYDGDRSLDSVERYEFELKRWSTIMNLSTSRFGAGLIPFRNGLLAVGGSTFGVVEIYYSHSNTWERKASLIAGRLYTHVSWVPKFVKGKADK